MTYGDQTSLVGLAPINFELYKDSHPTAYISTNLCHIGDNIDCYLIGHQFIVIFINFCINMAPIRGAMIWGLPQWIIDVFLVPGFAMVLLTCMIGKLATQVNASHFILDYINTYFAVFTFYTTIDIEFSDVMHVSYFIQKSVGWATDKLIHSNNPPKSDVQVALFAVTKLKKSEHGHAPFALKTCELLFCDAVQTFFNMSILGVVITTILGTITWKLVVSDFSLAFLSNPMVYVFLHICLFLEATGIASGTLVLATVHKRVASFQHDK
eukprot:8888841-Ditylum_brightwellii.AAC.1